MEIMDGKLPGDKKNKKKKKPTLRFELDLPDSTGTSCPEYSYIDLVRKTLKEKKSKGENDSMCLDLLEEEEEKERNEAEAMAKYFEVKYGATDAGHKHKRKDKVRDLVGAGYGYDENDPFVDDSEAYDEIVPATLTTQHGGFYINTGQLNFRAVSDQSDTEDSSSDDAMPLSHHISKKKKNHSSLLDTDESENEFKDVGLIGTKKRKKKLKSMKDIDGKKKRKISINGKDKVAGLKKSKKMKKPTSLAQKLVAKAKAQQMMNASAIGSPAHPTNVSQNRKKSSELVRMESKDLAQVAKQATKDLMNISTNKSESIIEKEVKNGLDATPDPSKNTTSSPENHELPPNLPQLLGDKIESLKKIAKSAEGEGKLKFFNNNVNRILLGIEESSQSLRTKERQGMYQHIAQHLPCSKDTLLKRVKKLQVNDSDQQLKGPIERLKAAVEAVMTSQIEAYLVECDVKSDKFFDKSACAASTDEDEECEEKSTGATLDGGEAGGEKVKRTYAPRRKFKWDDNLRKLLCDVVSVKMSLYERFKMREKNPEEYLKAFLESTIKPLWPKPWMQTRMLFKESRSAHQHYTFNSAKPKKTGSNKKVPGVTKESNNAAEVKTGQKAHESLTNNSAGQSEIAAKSIKKQLIYETTDSKHLMPPVNATNSFRNLASSNEKREKNVVDLTSSGGFELVASIESGNSPAPSPLSTLRKSTPSMEKVVSPSSWKSPSGSNVPKTKMPTTMKSNVPQSKTDKKPNSNQKVGQSYNKSLIPGIDLPLPVNSESMEQYASDLIKLMMDTNQLAHRGAYSGTPVSSNYDAISKILGLTSEDVKPANVAKPKQDQKFKFKISSGAAANEHAFPSSGFPIDVGTKRVAASMGASWSSQNPTPPKVMKAEKTRTNMKQKAYSSLPTTPVYAIPLEDKYVMKQLPNYSSPSVSSSNLTGQRSRSNQQRTAEIKTTVSPPTAQKPKIAQSAADTITNIHKLSSPRYQQNSKLDLLSSSCSVSLPKLQYSPSGASKSSISKSDVVRGIYNPMLLSSMSGSFAPSTTLNSFSPAYTSSANHSNSVGSIFKPVPTNSSQKYPSNLSAPMTESPYSNSHRKSYPMVNLLDIQGEKLSEQSLNMNIKANPNR